jgi:predicted membrane protein
MFDFDKEETTTLAERLSLLVAGPSGAGKSHLLGTHPGKTLYLTCGAEIHGIDSAKKSSKNIRAIRIDANAEGPLSPDQALARLEQALNPAAVKQVGFQFLVIDGLTELEKLVRETTKWKKYCETKNGGHDNFKETAATITLINDILSKLRNLQFDLGIDIAVTCILDVTEKNARTGEIEAAKPRLMQYGVAETLVQQFGDIIVIGQMTKPDGTTGRALQMNTELARSSVDGKTQEVKKIFGITPRLQGVVNVPAFIKADLGELLKLKGR